MSDGCTCPEPTCTACGETVLRDAALRERLLIVEVERQHYEQAWQDEVAARIRADHEPIGLRREIERLKETLRGTRHDDFVAIERLLGERISLHPATSSNITYAVQAMKTECDDLHRALTLIWNALGVTQMDRRDVSEHVQERVASDRLQREAWDWADKFLISVRTLIATDDVEIEYVDEDGNVHYHATGDDLYSAVRVAMAAAKERAGRTS